MKIFAKLLKSACIESFKNNIPPCPVKYDRNNVTAQEFREYIHWLAENSINKTVYEPDRFIKAGERELLEKREIEREKFRKFIKYLSDNNINRTFWC